MSGLYAWVDAGNDTQERQERLRRVQLCWGLPPYSWSEEQVLLRYELLYETGLVAESPWQNQILIFVILVVLCSIAIAEY